jgi:hypothetical protein
MHWTVLVQVGVCDCSVESLVFVTGIRDMSNIYKLMNKECSVLHKKKA